MTTTAKQKGLNKTTCSIQVVNFRLLELELELEMGSWQCMWIPLLVLTIEFAASISPHGQPFFPKSFSLFCLLNYYFFLTGTGGISARREERAGEHEARPGQADQNARVCLETRKVSSG